MTEYIDRDKLMEALKEWQKTLIETYGENDEYVRCIDSILVGIENAPAADVREVVRGKWYLGDDMLLHCSNCDQIPYNRIVMNNVCIFDLTPIKSLMKYCPNCGADMREES